MELTASRCGRWMGNRKFIWSHLNFHPTMGNLMHPFSYCCSTVELYWELKWYYVLRGKFGISYMWPIAPNGGGEGEVHKQTMYWRQNRPNTTILGHSHSHITKGTVPRVAVQVVATMLFTHSFSTNWTRCSSVNDHTKLDPTTAATRVRIIITLLL